MEWRKVITLGLLMVGIAGPAQATECTPPVQLSPMPGLILESCESWQWDEVELLMDYKKDQYRTVAGGHWRLEYWLAEGAQRPSPPQIVHNVLGAVEILGGRPIWQTKDEALARLELRGATIWVYTDVSNDGETYELTIVREAPMKQEMVARAEVLAEGLRTSGHATLTGILFDLDSDRLRPESDAALQQAAKLLQEQPTLSLWVVGHTDSTGSFEHNMDLSRRRAAAVVRALFERYGIAGERLEAHGVGPLAPVAANSTEDGRQRNRRVELVVR